MKVLFLLAACVALLAASPIAPSPSETITLPLNPQDNDTSHSARSQNSDGASSHSPFTKWLRSWQPRGTMSKRDGSPDQPAAPEVQVQADDSFDPLWCDVMVQSCVSTRCPWHDWDCPMLCMLYTCQVGESAKKCANLNWCWRPPYE